jgi:hypothetical protein
MASMAVQQDSSEVPPTWMCSIGAGMDTGSYSVPLTITNCTTVGNGRADKDCTGTGTLSATLPAVIGTNASGSVTATTSF